MIFMPFVDDATLKPDTELNNLEAGVQEEYKSENGQQLFLAEEMHFEKWTH